MDALLAMWTHPEVRRYLWDDLVVSKEQVVQAIESHLASSATFGIGFWTISLGQDSPAAGFCGFRFEEAESEIELIYGLLPEYWRRGFATESSQSVLEYIWKNAAFTRVWAPTDPPNSKSVAVLRRLEMRLHTAAAGRTSYVIERPVIEESGPSPGFSSAYEHE